MLFRSNNDNFYKKNNLQQVNKWNSALRLYFGESPICFNHIIETEQTLSHQKIHCRFYRLKNEINIDLLENNHFSFVEKTDLQNFAFPKSIVDFLKNNL